MIKYLLLLPVFALATVPEPTTIATSKTNFCIGSNSILTANCTSGQIHWWDALIDRSSFAQGNNVTFSPTSTGTYNLYVSCIDAGEESNRLPVPQITVYDEVQVPSINFPVNDIKTCSFFRTDLYASCQGSTIPQWYNSISATNTVATGTRASINVYTSGQYYVSCKNPGCESNRIATGFINVMPNINPTISSIPDEICGGTNPVNINVTTTNTPDVASLFWKKNNQLIVNSITSLGSSSGLGTNGVNDIYIGTDTILAALPSGLAVSYNAGTSFTIKTMTNGLPNDSITSISRDLFGKILVGTKNGPAYSTDGGQSFSSFPLNTNLGGEFIRKIVVDQSNVYYFCTSNGLFISRDGGQSTVHKTTANGLGSNIVNDLVLTRQSGYTFAATEGGLSVSFNGGSTFFNYSTLGNNYQMPVARALATDRAGSALYVAGTNSLAFIADPSSSLFLAVNVPSQGLFQVRSMKLNSTGMLAAAYSNGMAIFEGTSRIAGLLSGSGLSNSSGRNVFFTKENQLYLSGNTGIDHIDFENSNTLAIPAPNLGDSYSVKTDAGNFGCGLSSNQAVKNYMVRTRPIAPTNITSSASQACTGQSVNLSANCASSQTPTWYSNPPSLLSEGSGSPFPIVLNPGNNSYLVSCVDIYGCESSQTTSPVVVGTSAHPPTNVEINKVEVCPGETIVLSGVCQSGSSLRWYDATTSGNLLFSGSPFSTSASSSLPTYYAACITNAQSCESLSRVASNTLLFKPNAAALTINYLSNINANTVENAGQFLNSSGTVDNAANVSFSAGNAINLNPGFEAKNGTVFVAAIKQNCTNSNTPTIITK